MSILVKSSVSVLFQSDTDNRGYHIEAGQTRTLPDSITTDAMFAVLKKEGKIEVLQEGVDAPIQPSTHPLEGLKLISPQPDKVHVRNEPLKLPENTDPLRAAADREEPQPLLKADPLVTQTKEGVEIDQAPPSIHELNERSGQTPLPPAERTDVDHHTE